MGVNEYIRDSAVQSEEEDRLHHSGLAKQIAKLVATQPTPLHVAVYGPWGAGKSSLGRLIEQSLRTEHRDVLFVRIDAWKYAEDSFRRQFILEAARQLDLDEKKYRSELYQSTKTNYFKMPEGSVWPAVGAFVGILAISAIAIVSLALISAVVLSDGENLDVYFESFLNSFGMPAVGSAAFLAALVMFMGRLFTTEHHEAEASSEERFEQVFRKLIKTVYGQAGRERVLFYIDELDRCSAKDVVDVLESIRTFLDVDGCAFIVSADNRVLELAVQQRMPHPVPDEEMNPYYSSGAEYLDKLFQHQVSLPPLQPQRLTAFALELTEDADGVWATARESRVIEPLLSVLIPSHIRSPRRVKVLLNGFVSSYRAAKARHAEDAKTTPDPDARLLEVAKLSTLRLEFPLFYRDLIAHPSLIADLVGYLEDQAWSEDTLERARRNGTDKLVEAYANCARASATIISQPSPVSGDGAVVAPSSESGAEKARTNELLQYIRKSQLVDGPSRDMLFLESSGSMFGLSAEVADAAETAAVNNDQTALRRLVESLGDEDRLSVARLLHSLMRTFIGVEASNALGAALHLVSKGLVAPAAIADEFFDEIHAALERAPLPAKWLAPAAAVAAVSVRDASHREMLTRILGDMRAREDLPSDEVLDVLLLLKPYYQGVEVQLAELIASRQAGFILAASENESVSSVMLEDLVCRGGLLRLLDWREAPLEQERLVGQTDDFHSLLSAASEELSWSLLHWAMLEVKRTDLVEMWLDESRVHATTSQHTGLLFRAASLFGRAKWQRVVELLQGAPQSSSYMMYDGVLALFADIEQHGEDETFTSLRTALCQRWGQPQWPSNWKEPLTTLSAPAWSDDPTTRFRKHQLTRELSKLDQNEGAFWFAALAAGYESLFEHPGHLETAMLIEVGEQLSEDWGLLSTENRSSVLAALDDSDIDSVAQRLIRARLASVDAAVEFPGVQVTEIDALATSSLVGRQLASMWILHSASSDELIAYAEEAQPDAVAHLSDSLALSVEARDSAFASAFTRALYPKHLSNGHFWHRVLGRGEPDAVADWLSEQLRGAQNDIERRQAIQLWRAWSPSGSGVRRMLVEALIALAQVGKGSLELVIANLDLAIPPPYGTKQRLAMTVQERAGRLGLEARANRALVSSGLAKEKKTGLFGMKRVVEAGDEEQPEHQDKESA